jgi:hypothetical protein
MGCGFSTSSQQFKGVRTTSHRVESDESAREHEKYDDSKQSGALLASCAEQAHQDGELHDRADRDDVKNDFAGIEKDPSKAMALDEDCSAQSAELSSKRFAQTYLRTLQLHMEPRDPAVRALRITQRRNNRRNLHIGDAQSAPSFPASNLVANTTRARTRSTDIPMWIDMSSGPESGELATSGTKNDNQHFQHTEHMSGASLQNKYRVQFEDHPPRFRPMLRKLRRKVRSEVKVSDDVKQLDVESSVFPSGNDEKGEDQDSAQPPKMNEPDLDNLETREAKTNLQKQTETLFDLEGSETCDVTVVVRVRPRHAEENVCSENCECIGCIAIQTRGNTLALYDSHKFRYDRSLCTSTLVNSSHEIAKRYDSLYPPKIFTFDAVKGRDCTTDEVFQCVGEPAIKEVVRGVNATVFAYGQTGSGKTYTLLGESIQALEDSSDNCTHGIASSCFKHLRKSLDERAEKESGSKRDLVKYTIEASALQIYMNRVHDLFSNDIGALLIRVRQTKRTFTHPGGEVCELHPGETYKLCNNEEEFVTMLRDAASARAENGTHMNARSSRSHLILTLAVRRIVNLPGLSGSAQLADTTLGREYMSKLTLVDLAGNERDSARNSLSKEAELRAQGIDVNMSLSALGACLRERAKNSSRKSRHPNDQDGTGLYRSSTLTRLLKEALMSTKIFFLACCNPVGSAAAASGQTLTYAAMVKSIKTNAEDSAVLLEKGMDRFPIEFIAHSTLVKRGCIPRSDEQLTVYLHELRVCVVRVFVSHRWLSPSMDRNLAHPDGPSNEKHELLVILFQRLGKEGWIQDYDELRVVDWIDFCEWSLDVYVFISIFISDNESCPSLLEKEMSVV